MTKRVLGCVAGSDPVHEDADERAFFFLRSAVETASGVELTRGWHSVEEGNWRWTERVFAVRVPHNKPTRYASVELRFYLPEQHLARVGPIEIVTRVGDTRSRPQRFSAPGYHAYREKLPPNQHEPELDIEFELSASYGPDATDRRELGIVVPVQGTAGIPLRLERA